MIIRSLRLRNGRLALPKPPSPTPLRAWRRCLTISAPRREEQELASDFIVDPASLPPGVRTDIRDPTHPVAQNYLFHHHFKSRTQHLGGVPEPHYKPHELLSNPSRPEDITLELLMASQAHIGHATSLWHPANAKYIFGVRGDQDPIHIISLDTTAAYLRRACKVVQGVTERGGLVLFVGTRIGQARTVVKAAEMAQGCHLFSRWTPGSITNGQQILGQCRKKVVNERDEEILGFQDQLESKSALKPDLVVCLNPLENYILLNECGVHNIPTIGIIDTDANPTWVTYPIPANDDSQRCTSLIGGVLGRAGQDGQKARLNAARNGDIRYFPTHGLQAATPGQAQKEREAMERELQEERAYIDEGEVVDETLDDMEGDEEMHSDALDGKADDDFRHIEFQEGRRAESAREALGFDDISNDYATEDFAQSQASSADASEMPVVPAPPKPGFREADEFETGNLYDEAEIGRLQASDAPAAEEPDIAALPNSEATVVEESDVKEAPYVVDRPLNAEELAEAEDFEQQANDLTQSRVSQQQDDDGLEEQDREQYGIPSTESERRDR